jgi:hypothetical protein
MATELVISKLQMLLQDFGPIVNDEAASHIIKEAIDCLESDKIRPNVMRCAKCEIRVTGVLSTAACPNKCGPLWSVTWKEECQSAERVLESVHEEYALARKLLVQHAGEKEALRAQVEQLSQPQASCHPSTGEERGGNG